MAEPKAAESSRRPSRSRRARASVNRRRGGRRRDGGSAADPFASIVNPTMTAMIATIAADAGPDRPNVSAHRAFDRLDVRRRIPERRRRRQGGLGDRNRGQHHAGGERDSRAAIQAK
jgi:hypothetical protein